MNAILLSINPEYVDKILSGEKIYEFRKVRCKKEIDKIFIYSTSPIMKVVGEAVVDDILIGEPQKIWNITSKSAGINKKFFDAYYEGKPQAIAYKLSHIIEYDKPKNLMDYGIKTPPQSFQYITI